MVFSPPRLSPSNTHCQCCRMPQKALTGMIAHHGYTESDRETGFITFVSCPGSRYRPVEVSNDRMKNYIDLLASKITGFKRLFKEVSAETQPITIAYSWVEVKKSGNTSTRKRVHGLIEGVTADNIEALAREHPKADVPRWEAAKAEFISKLVAKIGEVEDELIAAKAALKSWKPDRKMVEAWTLIYGNDLWNPPLEHGQKSYDAPGTVIEKGFRLVIQDEAGELRWPVRGSKGQPWLRTQEKIARPVRVQVGRKPRKAPMPRLKIVPTVKTNVPASQDYATLMEKLGYA